MFLSVHVFVGAAAGIATKNPMVGFFAGLVSHHLMDMIPHWDPGVFYFPEKDHGLSKRDLTIAAIDFGLCLIIMYTLARYIDVATLRGPAIWGMIGSIVPDIWHNIPWWEKYARDLPILCYWYRFHRLFHATISPQYWWFGVVTQIVMVIVGWLIIAANVHSVQHVIGALPFS